MRTRTNRRWCLAARPNGGIRPSDFEMTEVPVETPTEGEILNRNVYLSLDPTNRVWVNSTPSYLPPVGIGEVMRGFALGVVEESRRADFAAGDIVQGLLGWQDYAISDGSGIRKVPGARGLHLPLTAHFGLFGHIGLTAYFGLLDIGKPAPGETVVVSAAAGAVGSLVGQIAKIKGCRVVGITGSDDKVRWLTEVLHFDAVVNYKATSVMRGLKRHCPDGIDVYFDNVGGGILDAALASINLKARIVLCGMISQYNAEKPSPGPYLLANAISKRARLEGFIVSDYYDRANEAIESLVRWYSEGRVTYRVDIVDGLEHAPEALGKLFDGTNRGKLLVKISEEPPTGGAG
ncbi:MAG: NADP-dependent oxidoreductase [bacterium]